MLIFHGANDVRCKVAESDMIVAAMQAQEYSGDLCRLSGRRATDSRSRRTGFPTSRSPRRSLPGISAAPSSRSGDDLEGSSHEIRAGADIVADLGVS